MNEIKFSLQKVSDSFTVFEDNQVLTAGQLNRVIEYLDDQTRLTRVNLLGVGIVCGLVPTYENDTIKISKGCAVTTDGDLIRFTSDMEFENYLGFKDAKAGYENFIVDKKKIAIDELHVKSSKTPGIIPLSKMAQNKIKKSVVILYIESYLYDPDICTGGDCDNMGKVRINNLKALLVNKNDADKITGSMSSMSECLSSLKSLKMKRVILNNKSIKTLKQLSDTYTQTVDTSVKDLIALLKGNFASCASLMKEIWEGDLPTAQWITSINSAYTLVKNNKTHFQYFYDFLKDFIAGLNELMDEFLETNDYYLNDYTLFPKHVCLGSFRNLEPYTFDQKRTGLFSSPLVKNINTKKLQFLFIRLHRMIINLNIFFTSTNIVILPDRTCCPKLGERVIPPYYRYNAKNPIHEYWKYDFTQQARGAELLSFHSDKYAESEKTKDPLSYEFDDCKLFRIGGHVGWNYDEAEAEINEQIEAYNLPFKVMSIQIENNLRTIPLRPIRRFRDVRLLHKVFRQDLDRNLTKVNSFNDILVKRVNETTEKPPLVSIDPKNKFKEYSQDKIVNLSEKITSLRSNLKKKSTEFNYKQFETEYTAAVNKASTVNQSIRGVTFTRTGSPYDLMLNQSKLNTLKWLDDILVKEVEKTKESSILEKFLKENPGMEHFAGVPWGGTFILVYSSSTKKVVADFSLPYWYCDCTKDEEVEETVEEKDDPIKWTDVDDLVIDYDRSFGIADKLKTVEDDFVLEKGKNSDRFLAINNNIVSKDEIDSKIDKKLTDKETVINNRIEQKLTEKESALTNMMDIKLTAKEATLNQKLAEKETIIRNDFDTRLSSKENEIKGSIDEKITQINTRFTENQGIFNTYKSSFENLINTTSDSINKVTTPSGLTLLGDKTNIADEKLSGMADIIDASAKLVANQTVKKKAGTLSAAEEKNLKVMEETTESAIVEAVKAIEAKGGDISAGSDEAIVLEKALEKSELLSEETRASLADEIVKINKKTTGRSGLSGMLDKFKLK
jgi:hypothetical protein